MNNPEMEITVKVKVKISLVDSIKIAIIGRSLPAISQLMKDLRGKK